MVQGVPQTGNPVNPRRQPTRQRGVANSNVVSAK
jgi:hypothetical protein